MLKQCLDKIDQQLNCQFFRNLVTVLVFAIFHDNTIKQLIRCVKLLSFQKDSAPTSPTA